ncbi:hypothetical protein M9194_02340 [Vibrio sp. S4M6]|uniref:hypothetical protein n=1 Tax=Vibrio sinus TaxID=2946865 RepID=UPI00202A58E2|nr:hypothetical protein [Vibrio sinus]MCL9780270.1 hypothetical protein [Vibrio sinus]
MEIILNLNNHFSATKNLINCKLGGIFRETTNTRQLRMLTNLEETNSFRHGVLYIDLLIQLSDSKKIFHKNKNKILRCKNSTIYFKNNHVPLFSDYKKIIRMTKEYLAARVFLKIIAKSNVVECHTGESRWLDRYEGMMQEECNGAVNGDLMLYFFDHYPKKKLEELKKRIISYQKRQRYLSLKRKSLYSFDKSDYLSKLEYLVNYYQSFNTILSGIDVNKAKGCEGYLRRMLIDLNSEYISSRETSKNIAYLLKKYNNEKTDKIEIIFKQSCKDVTYLKDVESYIKELIKTYNAYNRNPTYRVSYEDNEELDSIIRFGDKTRL